LMFAATYPERVQGLILESSAAWLGPAPEQSSGGWTDESRERFAAAWGTPESITADLFAPSLADDEEFRLWHQRYERNAASRDAIGALIDLSTEMDARGVLHRIECPVLMLHRVGDRVVSIDSARETCRLLRSYGVDVEFVEMAGDDHLLYAADLGHGLAAIERFTTGSVSERTWAWGTDHVEVVTMGRFDVLVDGRAVPTSAWGSKRARTLLKLRVAARGEALTRARLIDVLWPEDGDIERLGPRLSVQLSAVRRILRGGVIADRSLVRLDLDRVVVDIERWFDLADDALIVAEHHGDFLPEDRYEDWSVRLRDEIRARYVGAVRRLADASSAADAIDLWWNAVAHDPYDERSYRSLVATLRAEGRLGEARTAYQSYVAALHDLGLPASAWDDFEP
jgi:DNA-binding SARP family transcriptional activator